MRSLKEIANSTPADYLEHIPKNPDAVANQMIHTAMQKFPKVPEHLMPLNVPQEAGYSFLFVGAGAGLVVNALLQREQIAFGLETSKRGIASAPEGVWSYVKWALPWELPFPTMTGEPPKPYKNYHITFINGYLKELLKPDEWELSLVELDKISKFISVIETKG
jgi:hypothetical protein